MTPETETKKGDGFIGWGYGFLVVSAIASIILLTMKNSSLVEFAIFLLLDGILIALVLFGIGYIIKELNLIRMDLAKYNSKAENP
jgi:hypothetical protein